MKNIKEYKDFFNESIDTYGDYETDNPFNTLGDFISNELNIDLEYLIDFDGTTLEDYMDDEVNNILRLDISKDKKIKKIVKLVKKLNGGKLSDNKEHKLIDELENMFDFHVSESFWYTKKEKTQEPSYSCEEFSELREAIPDMTNVRVVGFDSNDKIKFSLFVGKYEYLTNRLTSVFRYKFVRTIGFGLSRGTRTYYNFSINKYLYRNGGGDIYLLSLFISNNGSSKKINKYYLCADIESSLRKIKEIEKSKR